MVILIMGASHTGKTALAQKLLKRYNLPLPINRSLENGANSQRKHRPYPDGR